MSKRTLKQGDRVCLRRDRQTVTALLELQRDFGGAASAMDRAWTSAELQVSTVIVMLDSGRVEVKPFPAQQNTCEYDWNPACFHFCPEVGDQVKISKEYLSLYNLQGTYADIWVTVVEPLQRIDVYCTVNIDYNPGGGFNVPFSELVDYQAKSEIKPMNTTIKVTELKKIHDVACSTWKTRIEAMVPGPFAETVELTSEQIDSMFAAANAEQTEVLEKVFPDRNSPKYVKLTGMVLDTNGVGPLILRRGCASSHAMADRELAFTATSNYTPILVAPDGTEIILKIGLSDGHYLKFRVNG
jgi:hypothetical protein